MAATIGGATTAVAGAEIGAGTDDVTGAATLSGVGKRTGFGMGIGGGTGAATGDAAVFFAPAGGTADSASSTRCRAAISATASSIDSSRLPAGGRSAPGNGSDGPDRAARSSGRGRRRCGGAPVRRSEAAPFG